MTRESIVLIGMPASGKSTIGRLLAGELGYLFTDLDVYMREKTRRSLQEIINRLGEAALMELEKQCMQEIDLHHRVVAPGGSLVYYSDLMRDLRQRAVIVFLDEPLENLEKRLRNAATRGIIGLKGRTLAALFAERAPLYTRFADIVIPTAGLSREEITRAIARRFRELT